MKYLLIGLGKSNLAIAEHLNKEQIAFDVFSDTTIEEPILPSSTSLYNDFSQLPLATYSACIKSPGIPHHHPAVQAAENAGLIIQNEISFSLPHIDQLLIGITGTNGKTTVTRLVEHILSDRNAKAVGNIGQPLLEEIHTEKAPLILELSSFQLKDVTHFDPDVSVFLNFQPSHLDYHRTLTDYLTSKSKVVSTQCKSKPFVYNQDDVEVSKIAHKRGGNLRSFSMVEENSSAFFDGKTFFVFGSPWFDKEDILLRGEHNIQNILAALLICYSYESQSTIIERIKSFSGVEHRLEFVPNDENLLIFNDSKSTNPAATLSAMRSFSQPVVLLLGGKDRGNDFSDVFASGNLKHICFFGEISERLQKEIPQHLSFSSHTHIDGAVEQAFSLLTNEDVLLLSPGCASWDQFENFEQRGFFFKETIKKILPLKQPLTIF